MKTKVIGGVRLKRLKKGVWFSDHGHGYLEIAVPTHVRACGILRQRFEAATRKEAEEFVERKRREFSNSAGAAATPLGPPPPIQVAGIPTFEQYVQSRDPVTRNPRWPFGEVSSRTAKNETSALEVNLLPFFKSFRLNEINAASVTDFRKVLVGEGYANATVNTRIRLLRKILNDAYDREILLGLPRRWPRPLKEEAVQLELNPDEVRAFLRTFDTGVVPGGAGGRKASEYLTTLFRWSKPLFVAAIHTGLSRSDLLNLRWSSVDFATGLVTVDRRKTGVRATIKMSKLLRGELLLCRSRKTVNMAYVFLTPNGEPYSVTTVNRYFRAALRFARITRRVRFHDLRHSFGSLLVSSGVPLGYVKVAMGHRNERTTERYARTRAEALEPVAAALDSLR
jgi:integrase